MKYYVPERTRALEALKPGEEYHWIGEDFAGLKFEESILLTEEDLKVQYTIEQTATSNLQYTEDRAKKYPDPKELNDALVKQHSDDEVVKAEGIAQEAKYYQDCLDVKEANPKPE